MSIKKLAIAGSALCSLSASFVAHGEALVQISTGVHYSSGEYGELTKTQALLAPLSARVSFGAWSVRASIPYVAVDGPADVSELIDDSGGSGTSNSGSGSTSSGSGSGSNSGSGSSGSSGGSDDNISSFSDDRSVAGIGDTSLAITYSIDSIADSNAYVDITGRVRLPTGNEAKGLGVGTTDFAALAELGWDADAGGVFVSGGRRFLGNSDRVQRTDGWQATVGGWISVGDRATVGAYYDWQNASVVTAEDPSSLDAYVAWRFSDAWKIELNGGVGLADSSADFSAGVTLSWRNAKRDR